MGQRLDWLFFFFFRVQFMRRNALIEALGCFRLLSSFPGGTEFVVQTPKTRRGLLVVFSQPLKSTGLGWAS